MDLSVPLIVLALAIALLLAAPLAFVTARRGGRFRGMPGWVGFWVFGAGLVVCLSLAPLWASFPLLAVLMFVGMKQYFFLAPLRPQDRWAILAGYLFIPCALFPAYVDSLTLLGAVVPVGLFLLLPALLSVASRPSGLLDSTGRTLLGALLFVFCAAHLGFMAHAPSGVLELFAVLVLMAELPQRMVGRPRPGESMMRQGLGAALAVGIAVGIGCWLGPLGTLNRAQGAVAGLLVAVAVTAGAMVAEAVLDDLQLGGATASIGRGAMLDRAVPALYAAPVYCHFIGHFAKLLS